MCKVTEQQVFNMTLNINSKILIISYGDCSDMKVIKQNKKVTKRIHVIMEF